MCYRIRLVYFKCLFLKTIEIQYLLLTTANENAMQQNYRFCEKEKEEEEEEEIIWTQQVFLFRFVFLSPAIISMPIERLK